MRAGHAVVDITPEPGLTLSGFAARRGQPSEAVDDPIEIHAVALEEAGQAALLLVFDLLGLGPELTERIYRAIDEASPLGPVAHRTLLHCTHNHSAPATVRLVGCGEFDEKFQDRVVQAAADAARRAMQALRPARLRHTLRDIRGVSHNRRTLLTDGRVVFKAPPNAQIAKVGPTWDTMLLARLDDESGQGIVGLCAWAAHPCVVCTANISAEFPGELRRRLSRAQGLPFVYLQGACADLNLVFDKMDREAMVRAVDRIDRAIGDVTWPEAVGDRRFDFARQVVRLAYQPAPSPAELKSIESGMLKLAETGEFPADVGALLANILNVRPGESPDPLMMRYIASCMARWAKLLLDRGDDAARGCDLALDALAVGPLVFPMVAAEVFCETGLNLRDMFPDRVVFPLGYGSPLVGYLPTDASLDEGGYESMQAYRFYGHPAPFAKGSEWAIFDAMARLARSL